MYTRKIYLTGGDPRELDEVFRHVPGVVETAVGEIETDDNVWQSLRAAVEVVYNPKKVDISMLLDILFTVVDPRLSDGQGAMRGEKYRAGAWYESSEDVPHIELYRNFLQNRGKPPAATAAGLTINDTETDAKKKYPCHAKFGRAEKFVRGAAEQQGYYQSHDKGEAFIDFEKLAACLTF
jgi:peptide-methionine (S)-S-oxide reductase